VLINKSTRNTLGDLAKKMLADAGSVQGILGKALVGLIKGGWEKSEFERIHFERIKEKDFKDWLDKAKSKFSRFWETLFFPTLWRGAEEAHETVRADWQRALVDAAQALLDEAHERMPLPANRTWRAITQAQSVLRALLHKHRLPMPRTTRNSTQPAEEIA
jgi:CRISPR system Cascade subunit CasA